MCSGSRRGRAGFKRAARARRSHSVHIGEPTTLGVRVASLVAALQGGAASGLNETDTRKRARCARGTAGADAEGAHSMPTHVSTLTATVTSPACMPTVAHLMPPRSSALISCRARARALLRRMSSVHAIGTILHRATPRCTPAWQPASVCGLRDHRLCVHAWSVLRGRVPTLEREQHWVSN